VTDHRRQCGHAGSLLFILTMKATTAEMKTAPLGAVSTTTLVLGD